MPTASVVVPTFGRPHQVAECVRALREMDYPADRLEIVVVDDGSPTALNLGMGAAGGPTVRLIRQENAGPARARNEGAAVATGEILAFTDDDCRPHPHWLRHLASAVARDPDALVGGHTVNALSGNLLAQASQTLVDFLYESFPSTRALRPFFTSNNIATSAAAFRAVGGFDETFRYSAGEDRDLSERWAARGRLRYVPEALIRHHHALSPGRFLLQHHMYGRGAIHLARRRRMRGEPPPSVEPLSFYLRMLAFPVRKHGPARGAAVAGLLAVSQMASLTGVLTEFFRPSGEPGADG
ncbi:MAG TPA: glycosyltransferase [Longimicrobiales bacterium]|nr:glycosyltransferase [Longimicrobiales bacterium]